jgi:hypothetical protein
LSYSEQGKLVKGAVDFVGEGVERGGGEGASAGEQEKAGFGAEAVREGGCGEAQSGFACGSKGLGPAVKADVWLGVEGPRAEVSVGEARASALEGGGGGEDGG